MKAHIRQLLLRYGLAVVASVCAWALTSLLWDQIKPNVGPLFFAAVVIVAWVAGYGPALLATALCGIASTYMVPWWQTGEKLDPGDGLRVITLTLVGLTVAWLNAARRAARQALAVSDQLRADLQAQSRQLQTTNEELRQEAQERARAQREIIENQKVLRDMAAELSLTEERQRRQVATQLHDGIGQMLAIAQMKLEGLDGRPESLRAPLDEVLSLLRSSIAEARSLTHSLSPPVLYEADFGEAAEWLAEYYWREHQLKVMISQHGEAIKLPEDTRVVLFQALRELLLNVVKHAHATSAYVTIFRQPAEIRMVVEDDGKGFSPAAVERSVARTGTFGLLNIRERVRHLGGQFESESEPASGARFTLSLPVAGRQGDGHGQ